MLDVFVPLSLDIVSKGWVDIVPFMQEQPHPAVRKMLCKEYVLEIVQCYVSDFLDI